MEIPWRGIPEYQICAPGSTLSPTTGLVVPVIYVIYQVLLFKVESLFHTNVKFPAIKELLFGAFRKRTRNTLQCDPPPPPHPHHLYFVALPLLEV